MQRVYKIVHGGVVPINNDDLTIKYNINTYAEQDLPLTVTDYNGDW